MNRKNTVSFVLGLFVSCAAMLATSDARSAPGPTGTTGFASVYGNVPADQAEFLSSPDHIQSIAANGGATAVWETLEHGEVVECLDCIAAVEPLLYDQTSAKTREIAAWWLRRRSLGVFGPGETYTRILSTLQSDPDPQRRAYAASALGEFLAMPGIAACATALGADTDPGVRAAAASALGRLNDDGSGALAKALGDSDAGVKTAALGAAGRINSFTGVASVSALVGDASPVVRRRTVEILDELVAKDAVASVLALAKSDSDVNVRIAACHALGNFGDVSAQPTLQFIAANDASSLVRDQATIALLRL